jgi:serine/threonine protein phosphatase PrpC
LRAWAESEQGRRDNNEDRIGSQSTPIGELLLVADGMGGYEGGERAATIVARSFEERLKQADPSLPVADTLRQTLHWTNQSILAEKQQNPVWGKMGSTLVLVMVRGSQLVAAHVGDSRAYLFRQDRLIRLTRDHTIVQDLVDQGRISESEARTHELGSALKQSVGSEREPVLEVSEPVALQPGDGILLCSDGLCGYVDDAVIANAIRAAGVGSDPRALTRQLIQIALDTGSEDNISVQFAWFAPPAGVPKATVVLGRDALPPRPSTQKLALPGPGKRSRLPLILAAAGVLVAGAAAFTWYWRVCCAPPVLKKTEPAQPKDGKALKAAPAPSDGNDTQVAPGPTQPDIAPTKPAPPALAQPKGGDTKEDAVKPPEARKADPPAPGLNPAPEDAGPRVVVLVAGWDGKSRIHQGQLEARPAPMPADEDFKPRLGVLYYREDKLKEAAAQRAARILRASAAVKISSDPKVRVFLEQRPAWADVQAVLFLAPKVKPREEKNKEAKEQGKEQEKER